MYKPETQTETTIAMLPRHHTGESGHPQRVRALPIPGGQDGGGTHFALNGSLFTLSATNPLA